MTKAVWVAAFVALAPLLLQEPARAKEPEAKKPKAPPPDAAKVVVRGRSLADALQITCQPAWADADNLRPVILVFDVTEAMQASQDRIEDALDELEERRTKDWQFVRLGAKPTETGDDQSDVSTRLTALFSKPLEGKSTVELLRQTLRGASPDTVLVYLADERFEDDCELEALIRDLGKKQATISVIGREAAFGHAWDDGIKPFELRISDEPSPRGGDKWHFGDVGRNPFRSSHRAPWHGGESAFPGIPYRWKGHWETAFNDYDWSFADMSHDERDGEYSNTKQSLPAGFGPYGLMRAAGVSGGRYCLVAWRDGGRRNVKYDYSRCNLFAPDLRSRKEILRDKKNPFLRATMAAWHALLEANDNLIDITPPLSRNARGPRKIKYLESLDTTLWYIWKTPGMRDEFTKAAGLVLTTLDRALEPLDKALDVERDVPAHLRRYEADALLMRHICRIARFEVRESLRASKDLAPRARRKGASPGVTHRDWVKAGRDADKPKIDTKYEPWDEETGRRLLAERNELLRRFAGTPWGEQIGLNAIRASEPNWWGDPERSKHKKRKKPKAPPAAPGGSSSGGPSTGGG